MPRSISKPLARFWRSRSALSASAARFLAALSALILAWSAVGGLMISVIRITYLVKKSAQLLKDENDNRVVTDVLYARVLSRMPTDREHSIILKHVDSLGDRERAFEDILWSLLNSAEFTTRN